VPDIDKKGEPQMVGKTFTTGKYGNILVLSEGKKNGYYKVKFLKTGHIDEFRKDAIKRGDIRDKYAVTLCGVGIIGDIKTKGKYKPYYVIWHGIINRCYNPDVQKKKHRKSYLNVTVCDRWKVFENFYHDCRELDGFDEKKFLDHEIVLDKDLRQRHSEHKVYSPKYCQWISAKENAKIQDAQQKYFIAYAPDGTVYRDFNITEFAKKHNLERRHISGVLHGRCKSTAGWKFVYEEIV